MNGYKARGIVLHTIKYGDTGLVAYILTDVLGRQSYMVQGVRSVRGQGNKAALLQPVFLVEFEGTSVPRGEMHRIREMRAAVPLRSIPFDVRKSTVALFMAELVYRLVREVEPCSPLFDFVWGAVGALDATGSVAGGSDAVRMPDVAGTVGASGVGADVAGTSGVSGAAAVANFHLWFMVGLSRHLGFYPGNEWAPGAWFDIKEGLFTPIEPCGACFSRENAELLGRLMEISGVDGASGDVARDVSGRVSGGENYRRFAGNLAGLGLNRVRRVEFLNAMLAYFGYHLDAVRDIRSVDILREVF